MSMPQWSFQKSRYLRIVIVCSTILLLSSLAKCESNAQKGSSIYSNDLMNGDVRSEVLIIENHEPSLQPIFEHKVIDEKIIGGSYVYLNTEKEGECIECTNVGGEIRVATGTPKAICTNISIGLEFNTSVPFKGIISAAHGIRLPECSKKYEQEHGLSVRFELALISSNCGLAIRRRMNPRDSIDYSIQVLVSFDENLSEDDHLFDVNCRFEQFENIVGTFYEVGVRPPQQLSNQYQKPKCGYTVRMQTIDGPIAIFAQLGDVVYHKWECNAEHYATKVSECYVHDGQKKKYLLVDRNGCTADDAIMSELIYDDSTGTIYAKSHVFRFVGSNRVFFNCLLFICPKADPKCLKETPSAVNLFQEDSSNSSFETRPNAALFGNKTRGKGYLLVLDESGCSRDENAKVRTVSPLQKLNCEQSKRSKRYANKSEIVMATSSMPLSIAKTIHSQSEEAHIEKGDDCETNNADCDSRLVRIDTNGEVVMETAAFNDPSGEAMEGCLQFALPNNIFIVLIVSNFISLAIATIAIFAVFKNYFSASLSLYGSNITEQSYD